MRRPTRCRSVGESPVRARLPTASATSFVGPRQGASPLSSLVSRRRRLPSVVALALAVSVLAGCSGAQREPTSYTDKVHTNFVKGCNETFATDAKASNASPAPKGFCECVYAGITDKSGGMKFDDFKQVNTDLTEKHAKLPGSFDKYIKACQSKG